jgi:hypothetical protein
MNTFEELLTNIPQQKQTQASLQDQLEKLYTIANKCGLYDAADYISARLNEDYSVDTTVQVSMSKDITKIATKDLEEELARRRQAEQEEKDRLFLLQQERQQKLITLEFVDAFQPNHYRSSCSDKNMSNGFGSTKR